MSGVRRSILILALVAACGGTPVQDPGTTTAVPETSTTQEPAEDPATTDTPAGAEDDTGPTTTTSSGRPVAPDFTLELGDGGEYTLSEAEKPVYLVFWAEW